MDAGDVVRDVRRAHVQRRDVDVREFGCHGLAQVLQFPLHHAARFAQHDKQPVLHTAASLLDVVHHGVEFAAQPLYFRGKIGSHLVLAINQDSHGLAESVFHARHGRHHVVVEHVHAFTHVDAGARHLLAGVRHFITGA